MTDKQKARAVAAYLAQMREDCRTAAGAAAIAGLPEVGKLIAWIASAPLDKLRGMRYTDIIKRSAQRAENEEGNKMKKLYIESDNGGRSVMLRAGAKWYVCDCSPSGYFGAVDILGGTEEEAAARMRKAIDAGDIYGENDCAENLDTFRYIPDYTGLSAEQIESRENDGRTCDYMRMIEI